MAGTARPGPRSVVHPFSSGPAGLAKPHGFVYRPPTEFCDAQRFPLWSKRDTIACAGIAPTYQNERKDMPAVGIVEQRVDMHPIEDDERCESLREPDVQSADGAQAILVGAVGHSDIRRHRQARLPPQVLADGRIKRLTRRGADPIGAGPQHEGRPYFRLGDSQPVGNRADLVRPRIVFYASRKARQELVREGSAYTGAWDLVRDHATRQSPSVFYFVFRPADRAAFSRSKRSTGHGGRAFEANSAVFVFLLAFVLMTVIVPVVFVVLMAVFFQPVYQRRGTWRRTIA